MDKYRVIVWRESCQADDECDMEVIGEGFRSWEDAARAGLQYCGELPYRYRIEQDDPY